MAKRSTPIEFDPPAAGRTILVFGSGTLAAVLWAAGIAQRSDPRFAWTDLTPPPEGADKVQRLLMARTSDGVWINGARPEDAAPPTISPEGIDLIVAGGSSGSEYPDRLREFLRLPALVQLLATRATRPDGGATVVLLGLDTVPRSILRSTFETRELHATVRREGITFVATYRGSPTPTLLERFDAAFRVDGVDGADDRDWSASVVRAVRGEHPRELRQARPLPEQWSALRLSPELLRLWTSSPSLGHRPR